MPETTDFEDWLLDGRRSRQQLNKFSSKVRNSRLITAEQKEHLMGVLNRAFRNVS